jgi:hypothetical protein
MSLQEALRMDHLNESTEELKRQVERTVTGVEDEAVDAPDPRDEEQWTFQFEWKDGRGRAWRGQFTNKILSIAEQQAAASLKARFTGGAPWAAIDGEMQVINTAVAHMVFSLVEKPTWAEDIRKLLDPALIMAIYDKVSSHETRFFRLGSTPASG